MIFSLINCQNTFWKPPYYKFYVIIFMLILLILYIKFHHIQKLLFRDFKFNELSNWLINSFWKLSERLKIYLIPKSNIVNKYFLEKIIHMIILTNWLNSQIITPYDQNVYNHMSKFVLEHRQHIPHIRFYGWQLKILNITRGVRTDVTGMASWTLI